jgi:vacuolar-type H+-ATPase subunit H
MRDVIQKVIATENEAKQLVQAAKAEAERLVADARKQARDLVASARQESRNEAEQVVAAAVRGAEQEKMERLACSAAEIETRIHLDETTAKQAVDAAVRFVCGVR